MNVKTFLIVSITTLFLMNSSCSQDSTEPGFNPDGWPLPDVQSATSQSKTKKNLGNIEALFELFVTPENTVFNKISTGGQTWAYIVDTDGEKPMEYILIRSNRLGNFDTKVPASETVPIPDWIKE